MYASVERVGRFGVADVTNARDDDQLRSRDARLELSGDLERGSLVERSIQQQGGDLDSGQDIAQVGLGHRVGHRAVARGMHGSGMISETRHLSKKPGTVQPDIDP